MTTDSDMSSWTDLLHSSSKLVEQAAPSAQFPPLQRNLDQLEALSNKLKSKTLRTEALFQSIAATRLLAREGINAEQLARDLKSFKLKTTFEDVFPAEATSVEEYLQQVREMAMVSAVQEAQKDNLRNFSDYMMTVLEDDWQKQKGDFLHSLSRISTLPRTKNQPGKDTLSPRSKRLKPAHPKKTEKEIRAFQKLKRKRIKHQSEASFMASILSDIANGEGDEEEEEIEKEEEKVEGEEEKGKEEEKDESSEDETIFPLNQTVTEPQPPPKFTSKSGKLSIEIASDDSTPPKTTHPSPPYHSPKSATEGPISRTEFQNLSSVVQALDSKSEAILKAVQGLAASVPSLAEREKHLDQLISARLKHTMEESEARWTKSTKDFLELIESIITLQNDTVDQFHNLHNNNARQHRRELKILLNQVRERDNCNLVIQAVLVKALSSIQHLIDIPNFKFDEVLKLMESLLSTIRDQAPTADAYNLLHSTMSTHFTSLKQHISDLRGEVNFGSSIAEPKGGEDDIEDEEKREDDQSPFDPMVTAADGSVKPWSQIAEEEQLRLKLSWSQWPKTLSDSFAEARIQAIAHRENLISEFRDTIPIHIESDPIIEDIDNPNLDQHDGISESEKESSGPNPQFIINPEAVKVMQSADKGKKTAVKTDNMSEDDDDDDDMTEEEKMLKEALKRSLVEQKGAPVDRNPKKNRGIFSSTRHHKQKLCSLSRGRLDGESRTAGLLHSANDLL